MLPYLHVGPLIIQLSGLALLAGLWIGTSMVEQESLRLRLDAEAVLNIILYGLVGGLVGARALYAVEHINAYIAAPLGLLSLSATALDLPGGLLVGSALAFFHGRHRRLPLRPTLDVLAPGLAVMLIAGAAANLLSGNGYGLPSRVPWAIFLWGEYRHPTQIYELVLAAAVLLMWKYRPPAWRASGRGFWTVVGLSAAVRLFSEGFHADSALLVGGIRLVQIAALVILAAAMVMSRHWAQADLEAG